MVKRTKTVVAAGVLVLVLGGAGAGAAIAQTTSTPADPHTGEHYAGKDHWSKDHAGRHHDGLGGVEHGELTVRTETGDKVLDVQRGVVTAVDATSLTVKSVDGFSATYTLDATTKVHKDEKAAAVSDVAVNDQVKVRATKTSTSITAERIGDAGPGQ